MNEFDNIIDNIYIQLKIIEGLKELQVNNAGLSSEELLKEIAKWN